MARELLDAGYRVAGLDVAGDGFGTLEDAHPDRARYHRCDVTSDEDVQAAVDAVVDEWKRIDVLVNNATAFTFGSFADRTPEDTRREFEVNHFGDARTIRAVLPVMRAQGGGMTHDVSSGVAPTGHPGLSGHASTKGAVEAFVRSLRLELRYENVALTLMYPPATNTSSAARPGYSSYAMKDVEVGRKLAAKIESTGPTITADWFTRIWRPCGGSPPSSRRGPSGSSIGMDR